MGESVWQAWLRYWETDEAKAESDRNSANRNKNLITHRGGSKSFQQYRQELEAESHGPVSYMDVFTRTHAVKHVNPDGTVSYTWQDDKSSKNHENFMEQRQKLLADTGRDQLTTNEEDVIFESVMDPAEHGRRYGFGNLASSSQSRGRRGRHQSDLADIEELRTRVAQLEEQNRQQAMHTAQLLEYMQQQQQGGGHFPSSAGSGSAED